MAAPSSRSPAIRRRVLVLNVLRLLFSALAVGLILFGLFTLRETSRSRGWAETTGRVISSGVNEYAGKGSRSYRPIVVYAYSAGAVRYMSTRISSAHSQGTADRNAAARVAARYPVGASVPVFYDPQDPEQAVLQRGGSPWLPILAGGAFSMLAVGMRMLRARAERKAAR